MSKLKERFNSLLEKLKNFIKEFPLTIAIIILTTIFLIITVDTDFIDSEIIENVVMFTVIFAFGTFFIETSFNKNGKRIVLYILAAIISIIFINCIVYNTGLIRDINTMSLIAYISTLFIISIYKQYKKSENKFNEYTIRVFSNIFSSTIIYGILNIGLSLLVLIFTELITDDYTMEIMIRTQIALLGLFYIPALLLSVTQTKKQVSTFIKSLVIYVSLPLILVAMLIVYMYLVKIFITQQIPSNVIFRITSGIFILGLPIILMASNYNKTKVINIIVKVIPYLFIPFIALQIYSMTVRTLEYGITPLRHISYTFIIFEIVVILLSIIKKGKYIHHALTATIVLILIATITPFNALRVSKLNQANILSKIYKEDTKYDNLTEEEKDKVSSAYNFLKAYYDKEKYIPQYISEEDREQIEEYTSYNYDKYEYISYTDNNKEINIEDYSKLIPIDTFKYHDEEIVIQQIEVEAGNTKYKINMSKIINDIIQKNEQGIVIEDYLKDENLVKIDDKKDLYIRDLYLSYIKDTKEIKTISIAGYILEKNI